MGSSKDESYMRRAVELAVKGVGYVNPNPMVGAVIVKDGTVIGEGYHRRYGDLHAERDALASVRGSAKGACIYVTLEPCCHHGKQPPCCEAIIESGISRVVVGSRDPNPLVSGGGVRALKEAGIEVVTDFLKEECDAINPVFFKYITSKLPYTVIKYAMTMDGKTATKTGASKWITGEGSREEVQYLRHRYMAIMAGIGTVLADDPMLNVRKEGLKSPVRVILDSSLSMPSDCKIVRTAHQYRTLVFFCKKPGDDKLTYREERLKDAGVETVCVPAVSDHTDICSVMKYLGENGIDSVLVEGGGTVNDSIIRAGLADRIEVFIAPKIFGGRDARSPVEGIGVSGVDEAEIYKLADVGYFGEDIRLSYIKKD